MKVQWDYTSLADAYLKRPNYSTEAINEMLKLANVKESEPVCDIGAGTANLTLMLAKRNLSVTAVEPNDAMRKNGMKRTKKFINVRWVEGTGEDTKLNSSSFNFVTFGSSFNVTDRKMALRESYRILKSKGWFACLWNHRDLNNPIQKEIEDVIKFYIKDYQYGVRREDQTEIILQSGLFSNVNKIESEVCHKQRVCECIEGWRSHATLIRQAGDKFSFIMEKIEKVINSNCKDYIMIPYTTRIWVARSNK